MFNFEWDSWVKEILKIRLKFSNLDNLCQNSCTKVLAKIFIRPMHSRYTEGSVWMRDYKMIHNQQIQYFIPSLSLCLYPGENLFSCNRAVFIYAFLFWRDAFSILVMCISLFRSHNVRWTGCVSCKRMSFFALSPARHFHHVVEIYFWIHEIGFLLLALCAGAFAPLYHCLFCICMFDCTYVLMLLLLLWPSIGLFYLLLFFLLLLHCCCCHHHHPPFQRYVNECIFNFNHFLIEIWIVNINHERAYKPMINHCHWNTLLLHISCATIFNPNSRSCYQSHTRK